MTQRLLNLLCNRLRMKRDFRAHPEIDQQKIVRPVIITGIPVIFAAWLAGRTAPAVAIRNAIAPWLREAPGVTYGVVGALVLLVIAWGPIPATRMVIPVLIMIALVVVGVEALRRQTQIEFPDATAAATRASLSAGALRARNAVFGAHNGHHAHNGGAPPPSHVEQLERLAALHDSGALNDDEFAAEKALLV